MTSTAEDGHQSGAPLRKRGERQLGLRIDSLALSTVGPARPAITCSCAACRWVCYGMGWSGSGSLPVESHALNGCREMSVPT